MKLQWSANGRQNEKVQLRM